MKEIDFKGVPLLIDRNGDVYTTDRTWKYVS